MQKTALINGRSPALVIVFMTLFVIRPNYAASPNPLVSHAFQTHSIHMAPPQQNQLLMNHDALTHSVANRSLTDESFQLAFARSVNTNLPKNKLHSMSTALVARPEQRKACYITGDQRFDFITFSGPGQMMIGGSTVPVPLPGMLQQVRCQVQWQPQLQTLVGLDRETMPVSSHLVKFRFSTAPRPVDKKTKFVDAFNVGREYDRKSDRDQETTFGTFGLVRSLDAVNNISLKYVYQINPVSTPVGFSQGGVDLLDAVNKRRAEQRIAFGYDSTQWHRLKITSTLGYGLSFVDNSFYTNLSYPLDKNWGFEITSSLHRYATSTSKNVDFSVSRKLQGRQVFLTYSTNTNRFTFDLLNTNF